MSKIRRKLAVFLVVVFLMVTFVPSVFASMPAVEGYIDIAGHWAEEAINKWSEKGIIYGYNGRFNPDSDITRAEFCAIINRIFGFTEKAVRTLMMLNRTNGMQMMWPLQKGRLHSRIWQQPFRTGGQNHQTGCSPDFIYSVSV